MRTQNMFSRRKKKKFFLYELHLIHVPGIFLDIAPDKWVSHMYTKVVFFFFLFFFFFFFLTTTHIFNKIIRMTLPTTILIISFNVQFGEKYFQMLSSDFITQNAKP